MVVKSIVVHMLSLNEDSVLYDKYNYMFYCYTILTISMKDKENRR